MFTWLRARPVNSRRAARPAQAAAPSVPAALEPPADELPPPFFADPDPAFLDGEAAAVLTPPPLPTEESLKQALAELPAYPASDDPDRLKTLLEIYRALDRIVGEACSDALIEDSAEEWLPEPVAPR